MKNIVLVGFMGTGKTIVSKALAERLKKTRVDLDELIELQEGKKISDIFKDHGEAYFRIIEKKLVKEISGKSDQIVDAGGGVVLDHENMLNLKNNGFVICLWTDPKVIYERTKKYAHRPLLNVENPMKKIEELLEHRRPFYEKADFHIDTTNLDLDAVIKKIELIVADKNPKG
ncbi:MAG: shikimate kinase [Candidatus Omnitrophota bacterium]